MDAPRQPRRHKIVYTCMLKVGADPDFQPPGFFTRWREVKVGGTEEGVLRKVGEYGSNRGSGAKDRPAANGALLVKRVSG